MRKLGRWITRAILVAAVLWLAWVGGGMSMSKNSTPSESTTGFWITVGAIALGVFGVRFIYEKDSYREPLKSTILAAFMVWFISAILTPVFQSAREAAPQFACLSNVKQLALATNIYLTDFDDVTRVLSLGTTNSLPTLKPIISAARPRPSTATA